jgi:methionyl-tRNA synthetase
MSSFYVTTPIYYVNDLPHIGHIYTTVVADVMARYQRLSGRNVRLLTGTDEHGQKIERAAEEEGVEPIELADRVVSRYHRLWDELEISHDDFIRTTEARHRIGVEEVVRRIQEVGDFYTDRHEGWYCTSCESFYTEKELLPGKLCEVHEAPVEWKSEDNIFFRLSRYQKPLLEWYERNPGSVLPLSRGNEVKSFVERGLRDLSVSRANLAWGIPFPGHPGQTIYVWLEALSNYITALGFGQPGSEGLFDTFWASEDGTKIHLVGKDILRFHAVYWPAFLMSAGLPLPTSIVAHGWWLRDERKISKSAGNLARPDNLLEQFGPDSLRYFLMREMVFGQDSQFSDEGFVDRFNSDLANDLGNTVSRVVTLSRRTFNGRTPPEACDDSRLIALAEETVRDYHESMAELAFSRALESLWRLLAETNQYLAEKEPWKLVKTEGTSPGVSRILWNGLEATRIVATGLLPFMPQTAPRILAALGAEASPDDFSSLAWGGTPTGSELPPSEPLFPRIDKDAYFADAAPVVSAPATADPSDQGEKKEMITIEEFFQTKLRIATVTAAERVEKSEKLIQLTVDLGDETRVVVAGIAKDYTADELVGKQVVIVANLKPAKLMGIESQGMVLAASVDGRPVLLHPESSVPNGTPVN